MKEMVEEPVGAQGRRGVDDTGGRVVEFRRYRLHPGQREVLIDLFDREFVETQETAGMRVIGQFRDLDAPDDFVWLRSFASMESRAEALSRFYSGPVWAAHRDAANGTMVNSDNVLLLRPVSAGAGFPVPHSPRPAPGAPTNRPGLVVSTVCSLAPRTEAAFAAFFADSLEPLLRKTGAAILAALVTERSPNSFPRLPVREGETAFVWFLGFSGLPAYQTHLARREEAEEWRTTIRPEIERRVFRPAEVSRLAPTSRSLLRG